MTSHADTEFTLCRWYTPCGWVIFDVCQLDSSSAFRDRRLRALADKILRSHHLGVGPCFRSPAGFGEDLQHGDKRGHAVDRAQRGAG